MVYYIGHNCRKPMVINHQIAGKPLKKSYPSKYGNIFMAQVMTRGMEKSRFIIQWAIRSQVPSFINLVCSSSTKRWLVLFIVNIDNA